MAQLAFIGPMAKEKLSGERRVMWPSDIGNLSEFSRGGLLQPNCYRPATDNEWRLLADSVEKLQRQAQ